MCAAEYQKTRSEQQSAQQAHTASKRTQIDFTSSRSKEKEKERDRGGEHKSRYQPYGYSKEKSRWK